MKYYEIIKDSRCFYTIVGANMSDSCERYAASQLQKYIYDSTGRFIPYVSDLCEKRGPEIFVGLGTRNASRFITADDINALGDDGFIIKTLDEDILITGKTSRGTLYGVYEFLRRFVGFRAFTKDVEKVDNLAELVVPYVYITEKPDFEYRDAYFRFAFDGAFCAKKGICPSTVAVRSPKETVSRMGASRRISAFIFSVSLRSMPRKGSSSRLFCLSVSERTPSMDESTRPRKYPSVKPPREKTSASARISPRSAPLPSSKRRR